MREYIFCSVMESPQIARRSPDFKISPLAFGAGRGWKSAKGASFVFAESGVVNNERQTKRLNANRKLNFMGVCFTSKARGHQEKGSGLVWWGERPREPRRICVEE